MLYSKCWIKMTQKSNLTKMTLGQFWPKMTLKVNQFWLKITQSQFWPKMTRINFDPKWSKLNFDIKWPNVNFDHNWPRINFDPNWPKMTQPQEGAYITKRKVTDPGTHTWLDGSYPSHARSISNLISNLICENLIYGTTSSVKLWPTYIDQTLNVRNREFFKKHSHKKDHRQ